MPSCPFLDAMENDLRLQVAAAASDDVEVSLTERELAVLHVIAGGASRREVATQLFLSVNTVKTYLRSAYHKLGATSRDEAIERARAHGLLDSPNP
jgi:DNA-binding CsgD family transcriptional regulator